MMQCPEDLILQAFVQCSLPEKIFNDVEEHISDCVPCRQKVEELERQEICICELSETRGNTSSPWSQARRKAEMDLAEQKPIPLPFLIPPYLLTERLAQGGMGEIYAGEHQVLKRRFAVKLIRQKKLLDPVIVERFHQEINAAGQLVHPNIVSVTDAGLWDGMPYLVMELLEGQTLAEYVHQRGGKLPLHEARELFIQAAAGLQHAHENGLIHCDVKPSNLWRMPDGTLKILDLGLTQAAEELKNETAHMIFGTPSFMAPEQYVPHAKIDARIDIYALGSVFFYLLTGLTPENCISRQIRFPQVREAGVSIPHSIQLILDRMTDPIASRRFPSMETAVQALRNTPRRSLSKRAALLLFILGTFATGAFLGLAGILSSSHSNDKTPIDAHSASNPSPSSENTAVSQRPKTQNSPETQPETGEDMPEDESISALEKTDQQQRQRQQHAAELADPRKSMARFQNELRQYEMRRNQKHTEQKKKAKQEVPPTPENHYFSGNPNVDFIADLTPQVSMNEIIQEFKAQIPRPEGTESVFNGEQSEKQSEKRAEDPSVSQDLKERLECWEEIQTVAVPSDPFQVKLPMFTDAHAAFFMGNVNYWEKGRPDPCVSTYPEHSALWLWPYILHGKYDPRGVGTNEKLRENVLKLAKEGNTLAIFWLGCEQWYGMRCPADRKEAVKWFQKAVGTADADENDGLTDTDGNAESDADKVSVQACFYFLGRAYDLGISVPKNRSIALKYYRKAEKIGPALAMLGIAYLQGDGVPQDEKEAFRLFEKSADRCVEGAYLKGFCLENGFGCNADSELALQAYRHAYALEENYAHSYGILLLTPSGLREFPSEMYSQKLCEHSLDRKFELWRKVPFHTLKFASGQTDPPHE